MTGPTCHELGVCNGRPAPGCTCRHAASVHAFAPGAIQRYRRRARLARWVGVLLELPIMSGLGLAIGVASGLIPLGRWL